uniref:tRNA (guanine(26)-N(2))-dimethyltransferase n=1 Tax=Oryza punctata TaxID=4537 RepID=A0A0E0L120_ORYPU
MATSAAAALSFPTPRALPSPLQPRRRRRAEPPACTHSERGVTFDPGSAFYRSDSAAGRDLAVLAATLHRRAADTPAPFLCLDAMCGCGVRALRYLAQVGADFVWANDASEALRPVIVGNLSRFERAPDRRWAVSHLDATRLLSERYLRREYFDVIDVDSFGGDAAYIRAALLALRIGGLLYLTSTDWRSARGYGSRSCIMENKMASVIMVSFAIAKVVASHGLLDFMSWGRLLEGYAACRSHIGANAIKTNCPIECCLEVAQEIRNLR